MYNLASVKSEKANRESEYYSDTLHNQCSVDLVRETLPCLLCHLGGFDNSVFEQIS